MGQQEVRLQDRKHLLFLIQMKVKEGLNLKEEPGAGLWDATTVVLGRLDHNLVWVLREKNNPVRNYKVLKMLILIIHMEHNGGSDLGKKEFNLEVLNFRCETLKQEIQIKKSYNFCEICQY